MPVSLIVPLIAQVGLPLANELIKLFESDPSKQITSADLLALHAKYGSKTADEYLQEAQQAAGKTI